ncbi:MAG: trypsin-like serine protease [Chloroflexota bacterium]
MQQHQSRFKKKIMIKRFFAGAILVPLSILLAISPAITVHAQEREEIDKVEVPMPLPTWKPTVKAASMEPSRLVSYDVETGIEEIIDFSSEVQASGVPESAHVDGGEVLDGYTEIEPDVVAASFNDLTLVNDPDKSPWRMNVKVFVEYDEDPDSIYHCSGALIDAKHVLTAGHCIFDHDNDWGWADSVRVIPGYDNSDEPYGDADMAAAPSLYSWTKWTEDENWDWDMGFIKLNKPIGALSSWFGYGFNNKDSFFEDSYFHSPGYPSASPYNGQLMYYWYGQYDSVKEHTLYHDDRAYGGQSGSSSYYIDRSDSQNYIRYVYGVLSHAPSDNINKTGHTRINSDRFYHIQNTIKKNTPTRVDLVPMNVKIGPTYITAGSRLNSMNFLLHNYSSATWSGKVNIKIYLSTNDNISTSDTLLATTSLTSLILPKRSIPVAVGTPPTIPATQSGRFWIGVIVDVADANVVNNDTDEWDAASIYVAPRLPRVFQDPTGQNDPNAESQNGGTDMLYLPLITH